MKRFTVEKGTGPRGFSRWVNPQMRGYLLACCDCGLVHEMQFKVFEVTKRLRGGAYEYRTLTSTEHGVQFRARRAERHTAQVRAKKKIQGGLT